MKEPIIIDLPDPDSVEPGFSLEIKADPKTTTIVKAPRAQTVVKPSEDEGFLPINTGKKYIINTTKCKCCGRKHTQTIKNERAKESDPSFIFINEASEGNQNEK